MSNRYGRHYIAGCEADRPRPMAYLHAGWRQKRFRRSSGASWLLAASLAAAALLAAGLWLWVAH